ncbi:MAG TPA: Mpo1-like protein [Rhodanobacteraceae bacterium]|nr:Mpo1-like protein [Rhodanobacteraceae bacterium]
MRSVNEWFGSYSADHKNPTNRLIHWLCVPVILWCVVALLWLVPVPPAIGRAGLWSAAAMFLAFLFYMRLSRVIGFAMAAVFIVCGLLAEAAYRALGANGLLWLAIGLFVLAWIGQFVGHLIEGRRPSFFTDLAYLLIGPAWLTGKLLRRIGVSY